MDRRMSTRCCLPAQHRLIKPLSVSGNLLRRLIQGWLTSCGKQLGTQFTLHRVTSLIRTPLRGTLTRASHAHASAVGWFPQSPLFELRGITKNFFAHYQDMIERCIFAVVGLAVKASRHAFLKHLQISASLNLVQKCSHLSTSFGTSLPTG
jgi:hypothetical protein